MNKTCKYCKKNMSSKIILTKEESAYDILVSESHLYCYCQCGTHGVVNINFCPMCRS